MIRHCKRCNGTGHVEDVGWRTLYFDQIDITNKQIAELEKELEDAKFRLEQEKHLSNEWKTQANHRLSETKKVKEKLKKERKLKHSLEVSIDLICKRHKEECSSLKQELKKVKKESDESATVTIPVEDYHKLINPDDIDWDFLTKIIDMDQKWSPGLLLTLFINYISKSKKAQYFKTKAGGEVEG